ncbi:PREDICTED: uncharacterized protein LOC104709283 [Camelina sativa]|uniref:Uncharacterized protein LOC104709283 n=1 Tax=Camelina sativa TaxID=90675 RepID=A0ABM0TCK4_CAMSA|nr:PREDICTED: uncharacterized protein LOC104709283 [Camelina sativa]
MAETRSQTMLKETVAREASVVVREAEEALGSQICQMIARTDALEKKIVEQNEKMDQNIKEMFSAIRLLSSSKEPVQDSLRQDPSSSSKAPVQVSLVRDLSPPRVSVSKELGPDVRAQGCIGQATSPEGYDGITGIGNIDFPRFDGSGSKLKERFDDVLDDPIDELKRLNETEGIVDYHQKFELLRTRVNMSEDYLVSAYLAGLRVDTQMHVRMFQPQTVHHCLMLGRLYEKAHPQRPSQQTWSSAKASGGSVGGKGILGVKKEYPQESKVVEKSDGLNSKKFLSNAEMSERRAKGLCYFCDEKYTPDHYLKHKKKQLFLIEVDDGEEESEDEGQSSDEDQVKPRVSVSAVSGVEEYDTMRVKGTFRKKIIYMLIDLGSTHNFMDPRSADMLGCVVDASRQSRVSVADGRKLAVSGVVNNFQWKLQNTTFAANFMLIPLGGVDVVLGIQWLQTLGVISWELKELEMSIKYGKQQVMLHGIKPGSVRAMKASKFKKIKEQEAQISMIYAIEGGSTEELRLSNVEGSSQLGPKEKGVEALLQEFEGVFKEPTELPPFRENHNHKIPLKDGANPVNLRPYRYAVHQKKWGLNELTIKDRFPIPLIEDLLDELGGSSIYSKIDLRAGYHQVRMDLDDVHKTAFKTHSGHYEYLVMPFGLTNAPATFQSLMNTVFRKYLRKFVLIFFDDILIYSATKEEHAEHLQAFFQLMEENQLFAKRSKCSFVADKVEYLGHYIEGRGVSTDPSKIAAVADWPIPGSLKQLRGFLGLAGYYRRFIQNFGTIARPLTALTKKDAFVWSDEAQQAFNELKKALCEAPVLALPRFDKPFLVETDESSQGIGAVLMQEGHPLAYISRHLKGKQLLLSIYEKELMMQPNPILNMADVADVGVPRTRIICLNLAIIADDDDDHVDDEDEDLMEDISVYNRS